MDTLGTLVIRSVKFVGTVVSSTQALPGDLPQIAFAGRSNVGKSSLINRLLGRPKQKIARVSATPGKTQALNFYEVNETFFLVDLPGSGYARVPEQVREQWRALVESFLSTSTQLKGVVYLVDARHPPSRGDQEFVEYLARVGTPTLIAVTKVDKLRPREREQLDQRIVKQLGVSADQVVVSSSKTGEGTEELLEAMTELLTPEDTDGQS
ncbi:MAG: ribosome biogenesis GTP-binding protein YihA/YsxC [Longimicrobiales bacterium]